MYYTNGYIYVHSVYTLNFVNMRQNIVAEFGIEGDQKSKNLRERSGWRVVAAALNQRLAPAAPSRREGTGQMIFSYSCVWCAFIPE